MSSRIASLSFSCADVAFTDKTEESPFSQLGFEWWVGG